MTRASKLCNKPGCGELIATGDTHAYCPQHRFTKVGWTERGTEGAAWRKLRVKVLRRAHHACYVCGHRATDVDHLLPRAWGGGETLDNLRPMCALHHRAKTQDESRRGREIAAHPENRVQIIASFIDNWR